MIVGKVRSAKGWFRGGRGFPVLALSPVRELYISLRGMIYETHLDDLGDLPVDCYFATPLTNTALPVDILDVVRYAKVLLLLLFPFVSGGCVQMKLYFSIKHDSLIIIIFIFQAI